MGLLYALSVDTEDGTTTVQVEANSKEEALESGEELYPGCRLALVNRSVQKTKSDPPGKVLARESATS
jgi:hypothetical protein